MNWKLIADLLVIGHLAFILFAFLGGILALRWRWIIWVHLPSAAWAALIEFCGWICPLTYLENSFRSKHSGSYDTGFVEHYVIPVLYPEGLTRPIQVAVGVAVVALNIGIYAVIIWHRRIMIDR